MSDPSTVHSSLERIINRCLSDSCLSRLNEFFDREHDEYITSTSESKTESKYDGGGGEAKVNISSESAAVRNNKSSKHREYSNTNYNVYQRFSNLMEEIIQDSCSIEHIDIEQFYSNCASETLSPAFDVFSKVLLISTDFQTFDDVMRNDEMRRYMFKLWRDWGNVMSKSMLQSRK